MERWQREYVTKKRPELVETTFCNSLLLSILRSKNVLALVDVDILNAKGMQLGQLAQTSFFYEIIETRCRAYDILVKALHDVKQYGPRDILMNGYLEQEIFPPFEFVNEIINWDCQHFSLANYMLSKFVIVQRKKVRLAKFCRSIDPETLKAIMKRTVDKNVALEILDDKRDFTFICSTIPTPVEYYISRTLKKRTRLNLIVLQIDTIDVFLVKIKNLDDLAGLAFPSIVARSSSQLEKPSVRHILCESDDDFETIRKKIPSGTSLHLLSYVNDGLYWIKSHGTISTIRYCIHENQTEIDDESFAKTLSADDEYQHVCISDSPGMGKTMLLANLAHSMNHDKEDAIVFFFEFRDFVQHFPTKSKEITASKIRDLISSLVTKSLFAKEIVHYFLTCPAQKIELFLDGFDEVLDEEIDASKHLLQVLRSEFSNIRLHVTARPHMLHQLEDILVVFGYNILPFELRHQIDFLVAFWQFHDKKTLHERKILESFAERCLVTLKSKMVDKEFDIAGVPLQCSLLGEIYQTYVGRLLDVPTFQDLPLVDSLNKMYDKLMQLRFDRAKEQQKLRSKSLFGVRKFIDIVTKDKTWEQKMKEVHYLAAVDLLFPEFKKLFKSFLPIDHHKYLKRREVYDLGIIEAKDTLNTNYRFSHRTFAEFLIAELLVILLTSENVIEDDSQLGAGFLQFVFGHVFKTHETLQHMLHTEIANIHSSLLVDSFDYSVITYFINARLSCQNLTGLDLLETSWITLDQYIKGIEQPDSTVDQLFTSCASSNLKSLFNFLAVMYKTINGKTYNPSFKVLVVAAKNADLEFNQAVYDLVGKRVQISISESEDKSFVTPLQVAVQRGDYSIVQVLINHFSRRNLLHICVAGSKNENKGTIADKKQIIKLILKCNADSKNERLKENDTTCVLQYNTHLKLVQCLLESGADSNTVSIKHENVLHTFLHKLEGDELKEKSLIKFVSHLRQFNFNGFNGINDDGDSPLCLAMRSVKLSSESLILFKENCADFLFTNRRGDNLLFIAISHFQSVDCLEELANNGVDKLGRNSDNMSLLHAAVESGHIESVEFLLKKETIKNELIDSKDVNGNTPLHIAYRKDHLVSLQMQDILVEYGANLNKENDNGLTPLEYGLENAITLAITVDKLKQLEIQGFTPSPENVNKLLRAILLNKTVAEHNIGFTEFIVHLISIGGRLKCDNESNLLDNKAMQTCLTKISQNLFNSRFGCCCLENDIKHIFHEIAKDALSGKNLIVHSEITKNSFFIESVIYLLLCIKEYKSFHALRKVYQSIQVKSMRFVTTLNDLVNFYELVDSCVCVVFTEHIILTVAKIQDAIDSCLLVTDFSTFNSVCSDVDRNVVVILQESCIPTFLEKYINTSNKFICIVYTCFRQNEMQKTNLADQVPVFLDEYKWESLNSVLQNKLIQRFFKRCKRNLENNSLHISKLSLRELFVSDVLPLDFLIPIHVKNYFSSRFAANNIVASYHKALQQRAFEKLFPHIKNINHVKVSVISEQHTNLILDGPTISYLTALWISDHFTELWRNDERFLSELFSCSSKLIELGDSISSEKRCLSTYVFDKWLLLYFLNKCSVSRKETIAQKILKMKCILHSCINLNAPNLLNLLNYQFSFKEDILNIASMHGNVHVFFKVDEHWRSYSTPSFIHLIFEALEKCHNEDLIHYGEIINTYSDNICSNLVEFSLSNTFEDSEQLVQRKLLVLLWLVENCNNTAKYIMDNIKHPSKVNSDLLKYSIVTLQKRNATWRLENNFIAIISSYMTEFSIYDLIQFALQRGQYHLTLTVNERLLHYMSPYVPHTVLSIFIDVQEICLGDVCKHIDGVALNDLITSEMDVLGIQNNKCYCIENHNTALFKSEHKEYETIVEALHETQQAKELLTDVQIKSGPFSSLEFGEHTLKTNMGLMKEWQKEYIRANKQRLLENTVCSPLLLSILESKAVLGLDDLIHLDTRRFQAGEFAQARLFYEITATRSNAYSEVIHALHNTKQTGARDLLMYGYIEQGTSPPFPFAREIFTSNSEHFLLHKHILSKFVNVQGQKLCLSDVCKHIHAGNLQALMERTIVPEVVFDILDETKNFTLIRDTIPAPIKYYIPRKLKERSRLNLDVLQIQTSDIFLVQGIKLQQFTNLAFPNIVDTSGTQVKNKSVQHILCENIEDFLTICKKSPQRSVHLLVYDKDMLHWIKSRGEISTIQQYVHEDQIEIHEETFINNLLAYNENSQAVCISDSPGMGKTILLTNIAHQLNVGCKDTLVFYFVLREFVQHLPTKSHEITAHVICELISYLVTASKFGKEVVQQLMVCQNQKIDLCFDGFDEILDRQLEASKQLLRVICSQFRNIRLLVTTRPHMLQELEDILCVVGCNIQPFEHSDQIDFLVGYWQCKEHITMNDELGHDKVFRKFAKRCLDTLENKMATKEFHIAGVPLQCRLLGEIYRTQIKSLLSAPMNDDEPLVNSLHQMYDKLMHVRLEKAKMKHKSQTRESIFTLSSKSGWWERKMKEVHYLAAVDLLFPEFTILFKKIVNLDHRMYLESPEVYDLGILETTNMFSGHCRFAHRTFAEFLFAELLVKIVTSEYRIRRDDKSGAPFLNFLFHHAFKTQATYQCMLPTELPGITSEIRVDNFVSPVITYFINAQLNDKRLKKIHLFDIYKKYIAMVPTFDVRFTFSQIFVSCAAGNLTNLFDLLVQLRKMARMGHLDTSIKLAVVAAKFADFGFNRALYNLLSDASLNLLYTECREEGFVTPIQVAAQRGEYDIVQVIMSKRFVSKNVLHACVAGSHFDTYSTICSKIEIMKLILDKDKDHIINERLAADDSTPILQSYTDKNLVEWLLKNGADASAVSIDDENILHKFLQAAGENKLQEESLTEFLGLLKNKKFCDYNRINTKGDSPISLALRLIKLSSKSLKLFKENRVDFTNKYRNEENLLFVAIKNQQSVECLQTLVANGVNIFAENNISANLLHVAVDAGHIEAVKFLLGDETVMKKLIQSGDHKGNTPLHIAYATSDQVRFQIQNILIASGANLFSENSNGYTPLEYGLANSSNLAVTVEKLQDIERKGYMLSNERVNGLIRAIFMNKTDFKLKRDFRKLLLYLISIGGEIKCKNGSNLMESRIMKNCLKKISQDMSHNSHSRSHVQKSVQQVLSEIVETELNEHDKKEYLHITHNKYSVESVVTLILFLKHKESFRRLQVKFQLIESGPIRPV